MPLSFAQERLWFLEKLHPGTPTYNMPLPLRFKTRLNRVLLAESLQDMVDRQDILRTSFTVIDGRPQQVIYDRLKFAADYADLSGLPPNQREERAKALVNEDAARPFDLQKAPLLRVTIVKLDDQDFIVLLCVHHIIADGWSMNILVKELTAFYAARAEGGSAPLPPLPIQYADFAVWQRELAEDRTKGGLQYWIKALSGIPEVLELPTDRPRPARRSMRGGVLGLVIEQELATASVQLARSVNATLFHVLFAAFAALLFRYSGQAEFAVGTPVANRSRQEFTDLVGLFINTLGIPCRIDPKENFVDLVDRMRQQAIDALTHQSTPFEQVVEVLQPNRNLSISPLFQVLFVLQSSAETISRTVVEDAPDDAGLGNGTSKFDLTLTVAEANEKLYCTFEYSEDLFEAVTVARIAENFRSLLHSLIQYPHRSIAQAPMISPVEYAQAIAQSKGPNAPPPPSFYLDALFSLQAQTTPDLAAVVHRTEILSYRLLDERSSAIARCLATAGVLRGDRVCVCMSRTPLLVASLIAVLKTGACYVPLDPKYPAARNEAIVRDCTPAAIVTETAFSSLFASLDVTVLCADAPFEPTSVDSLLPTDRTPDDAAYIIYTSGSTGVPKGVVICHRSVATFVAWVKRSFSSEELAGVLASTSICFDLSIFELFGALCAGGAALLVEDALDIGSAVEDITLLNTVPSAARQLLQLKKIPDSVKTICLAGEALSDALARRLYLDCAVQRIFNLYGPTEDTTYSTMAEAPRDHYGRLPIGRPIDNRRAYVLDEAKAPAPAGVCGEIHLAGAGVALGYHNRPDLTAQRFLDDPFTPGEKMFATGDLGRRRADGSLEYLGRLDNQVKFRGYRIETDEIRSVLNAVPEVEDSLVTLWDRGDHEPALAAYVVPKQGKTIALERLLAALGERLPEWMTPGFWSVLPAFPLNANGKVDLRQLPEPAHAVFADEAMISPPRSDWQKKILELWRGVLKLETIGVDQNFFRLGGHSLLLTQVAGRLQEEFGIAAPLHEFFEHATIAGFADRLEELLLTDDLRADPAVRSESGEGLPLSYAQERLWFLEQFSVVNNLYVVPWSFVIVGPFELATFDRAIQDLAARHETLRTSFSAPEGLPTQSIEADVEIEIEFYNLTGRGAAERDSMLEELSRRNLVEPFDLTQTPLLRCVVARESIDRHVVFVAMHHIVSDAWSLQVLQRDLGELYQARLERRAPKLPELTIQYADFALAQRRALQGAHMTKMLDYWRGNLSGAPPISTFPEDFPRPQVQTYHGSARYFTIDPDLKARMEDIAQSESTTLFAVILAGFIVLLSKYTGEKDIVVGAPLSGRHHAATENLVGFFVNTIVLRVAVDAQSTFRALVRLVRTKLLEAYDNQDAPFERVVDELKPARTLRYSPLFQVMFGFQASLERRDAFASAVAAPRSSAAPQIDTTTSKFDITFALTDQSDSVSAAVEYNTDLYRSETIDRIFQNYITALDALGANADQPIAKTRALSAREHALVTDSFNQTVGARPGDDCWPHMFSQQVARTPNAPALLWEGGALSYRELDTWSNAWARALQDRGVAKGDRVAVVLDRGIEFVVAVLATMKAGAVFAPLDASAPDVRLEAMVRILAAKAVFGHAHRRLQFEHDAVWLDVEALERDGSPPASTPVVPFDLAYVIFTSGSTGAPKGVAIEHRSMTNLANAMDRLVYSRYGTRFPLTGTLNAPLYFDAMIERLAMLLRGHALHLIPDRLRQDPAALAAYCREHTIDVLDFTPSHLLHLMDEGLFGDDGYRPCAVIVGGEAISPALWRRLAGVRDTDIFNVYGPTEATVNATACRIQDAGPDPVIGRPILNTRVYVLDDTLAPAPIGVVGEVFIAGEGLARGYWNAPELTAESFIDVSIDDRAPERMYRTGDRARWLPDGLLSYCGRNDQQIKIRGYRIEPAEITAVLSRHPAVREVAVVAREDTAANPRLVAYVVLRQGARVDVLELRAHARRELPDYMVPVHFQIVEALPLTASGKLDLNALPAPETLRPQLETRWVPPQSELEIAIAEIWSEVLGVERIGVDDSFFDLGGYSLLAVQVVSRIRKALRTDVSPRDIFEAPTIAELARRLAARGPAASPEQAPTARVSPGVAELSDAEVDDLLKQMLEAGKK
jgi:amino acid adenylation domain-containing protein